MLCAIFLANVLTILAILLQVMFAIPLTNLFPDLFAIWFAIQCTSSLAVLMESMNKLRFITVISDICQQGCYQSQGMLFCNPVRLSRGMWKENLDRGKNRHSYSYRTQPCTGIAEGHVGKFCEVSPCIH